MPNLEPSKNLVTVLAPPEAGENRSGIVAMKWAFTAVLGFIPLRWKMGKAKHSPENIAQPLP